MCFLLTQASTPRDINYTAGRYFGSAEVAAKRLPFDAGFESVGAVAAAGPDVQCECPSTLTGVHEGYSARPVWISCLGIFHMQGVMRADLIRAHLPWRVAWWLDSYVQRQGLYHSFSRRQHLCSGLCKSSQLPVTEEFRSQARCLAQALVWGSPWQSWRMEHSVSGRLSRQSMRWQCLCWLQKLLRC